jgi:hypothetical protein
MDRGGRMNSLYYIPGILGVLLVVMRLVMGSKGPPSAPRGRVCGVVGLMGTGKTLYCVREAHRRLRKGQKIATNFTLDLPEKYKGQWVQFDGWTQIAQLRGCTVIVDEAHLYAPALNGFKLPVEARWAISMCRHLRCDVFWITQHPSRVAASLRDLTGELIQCRKVLFWHHARGFQPEEFGKKGKYLWACWYRPGRKLAALYDTMELIRPAAEVDSLGVVGSLIIGSQRATVTSMTDREAQTN